MNVGIRRIDELSRNKAVRNLFRQLRSFCDRTLHTLCAFCQHQLRAVGFHQTAAFHRHRFRHDDNGPVAAACRDRCESDSCIAGGRLNNDRAFSDNAAVFRVVEHRFRHPVFDGAGRIKIFELSENFRRQFLRLFEPFQFDQRCCADQFVK